MIGAETASIAAGLKERTGRRPLEHRKALVLDLIGKGGSGPRQFGATYVPAFSQILCFPRAQMLPIA